jgi:hypothetical protein
MDRTTVYPTEQPTATTWLGAEKAKMIAQGYLAQGILGTSTVVDGLSCIPTIPASLAVTINPGSIYQLEPVDSTSWSSLPLDTVHQIIKQGISLDAVNLTLIPPGTSGQAINYLIEAAFSEQDTGTQVLPYFNSANPLIPFSGPAGSGVSQPTLRQGLISLVAKAGVAATAGTQVTPAPDVGYVGMWVVTVANGATQLTSAQISQYAAAPFILVKLPQLPYWVQQGTYWQCIDAGAGNGIVVSPIPVPSTQPANLFVRRINFTNTGAMVITIVGSAGLLGPYSVIHASGAAIASGDVPGNFMMHLNWDGTSYRLMNSKIATAVGSLSASSGEGINVTGGAVVNWYLPGLVDQPIIANTDLFGFYSAADTHHRVETWAQLLANIRNGLTLSLLNVQFLTPFTVGYSGTYVPTTGTRSAIVLATGGGGSAGCAGPVNNAAGGWGGGTAFTFMSMVGVASVAFTIGHGGAQQTVPTLSGYRGGATIFGIYCQASGGPGGWGPSGFADTLPGTGLAGNLWLQGGAGEYPTGGNQGGGGGSSFWAGGGAAGSNVPGGNPTIGSNGSGGGSAHAPSIPGQPGGDGLIVVIEFG